NRSMPAIYKFTSWWGGQEGSLLLWAWLLSPYSAIVVFTNRRKFRDMMPYVTTVLMVTETFFLMLITFVLSPFQVLAAGEGITDVGDGQGLNPLLQYWTMVIHPPLLYLGYVGFIVPFAFAIGSLITRQPGGACITRACIVPSVGAFAQYPIGKYFVGFLAFGIATTVFVILNRLDYLKSEAKLEGVVSRESSFLFNNLILLASCFAVLWGTLFPVITEKFLGEKVSVDARFFTRVRIPIDVF